MKARRYLAIAGFVVVSVMLLGGCTFIFGPWSGWDGYNAELSITVEWDDSTDVDLYVSYPYPTDGKPVDDYGTPVYWEIMDSYEPAAPTASRPGDDGFWPEDGVDREGVSAGGPSPMWASHSTYYAGLAYAVQVAEESSWEGGPETIVIRDLPFDTAGLDYNTNPSSDNGLPGGADYAWVGVMEVYLYADGDDLVDPSGSGARPVIRFHNADGDLLAELALPEFPGIEGSSVARINLFRVQDGVATYNLYQILPDFRLYQDDYQFRSIGEGSAIQVPEVINVRGR